MDKKEARRNRIFLLKACLVLLLALAFVGLFPHARFTGKVAYHQAANGVWLSDTSVTPALTVKTHVLLPAAALQQIAAGEDITPLMTDLATVLDVERIKEHIKKKEAAFTSFESPFKDAETPPGNVLLLFAESHRQFAPKLDECLRKLAYLFDEETEATLSSRPLYTRGKIPHYNADWVYVSAQFTMSVGNTKVCQIKSNCVGTVKERTGEKGDCW